MLGTRYKFMGGLTGMIVEEKAAAYTLKMVSEPTDRQYFANISKENLKNALEKNEIQRLSPCPITRPDTALTMPFNPRAI